MKHLLIVICLLASISASSQNDEKELTILLTKYAQAFVSENKEVLDTILDDNYYELSSGISVTKKQMLQTMFVNLKFEIINSRSSISGENAFITSVMFYGNVRAGIQFGLTRTSGFYCGKKNGHWIFLAAHHAIDKQNLSSFTMLPVTDEIKKIAWIKLLEDKQGDVNPGAADGKAFYYLYDKTTDLLWFRLEQYNPISLKIPAISISLDIDADQGNGLTWYGSNKSFKYDTMLSVGAIYEHNNSFIGYNGSTNECGAQTRTWVNEKRGIINFWYDVSENAYIISLKKADLAVGIKKINLIASVGLNPIWNDDICDGNSYATIQFEE